MQFFNIRRAFYNLKKFSHTENDKNNVLILNSKFNSNLEQWWQCGETKIEISFALWDASIYACIRHAIRSQCLPNYVPTTNCLDIRKIQWGPMKLLLVAVQRSKIKGHQLAYCCHTNFTISELFPQTANEEPTIYAIWSSINAP